MIELIEEQLTVMRHGRRILIQTVTEADYYRALLAFGVRPVEAAAATKGLITLKLKATRT